MNSHSHRDESQLVIVGDYLFDPREGCLSGPSGAHHICPRMSDLLICLAESPCRVVSRERLTNELWADEPHSSSSLTQCVGRLRQYFGDTARVANYIETVPRRGYRLVAPVYGSTRKAALPRPANMVSQNRGSGLYRLIREFRERKVCRSMLIYSIVIWLVFQISEVVVPALNLPVWVNSLVVILGILGFPIAATLAWIFDLTPNGLVRESGAPVGGGASVARNRSDFVFDTVLATAALAICAMLVLSSFDSPLVSFTEAEANETTQIQEDASATKIEKLPGCLDLLTQTD
jgi:DNA-binding winged helix-turn-helix (wHTH) protein